MDVTPGRHGIESTGGGMAGVGNVKHAPVDTAVGYGSGRREEVEGNT